MKIVRTVAEIRDYAREMRLRGRSIGLVPTKGALHGGHESLMKAARRECDVVVVSAFADPAQFSDEGGFEDYPRDEQRDAEIAARLGVDVLFAPEAAEISPDRFATAVGLGGPLVEAILRTGLTKDGQLPGKCTIATKLFDIVEPDVVFFEEKDLPDWVAVERMVRDLNLAASVKVLPTARESDGLAMSSRNLRLGGHRPQAVALYRALRAAADSLSNGATDAAVLRERALAAIAVEVLSGDVELDYFEALDSETLEPVETVANPLLLAIGARVGAVALFDIIRPDLEIQTRADAGAEKERSEERQVADHVHPSGESSVDIVISRHSSDDRIGLIKQLLDRTDESYEPLRSDLAESDVRGNIENFVGAVPIPLGLCGPLEIRGREARGTFAVPMATLEGTLLASYSRGAKVMNRSGGCETLVYDDYFLRATQLTTDSLDGSARLIEWCREREDVIREIAAGSSRHLGVAEISYDCAGTSVILSLRCTTGDAMGSNMVSKAVSLVSNYVKKNSGLVREEFVPYPEDKKNIPARKKGKKVIARTVLKEEVVRTMTRVGLDQLARYIRNYKNALALHGSPSLNIHAVNGMAALFQAFGQDMAYLGECSQGVVDCQFLPSGDLEVSITLPTLIVGTVGGGTGLPAFRSTLSIVDCYGAGKAKKLAEIMAAVILGGEIGCAAAQCSNEFVAAHESLGKNRPIEAVPQLVRPRLPVGESIDDTVMSPA
ncbi:pantoate--beta-alanine ligase [Saccharopolyspora pogona]|uniref:pantoate--beta-alanine ligase n=1 Tax=Saccharopolyspora pogona TaxID=333966 RepID=UPI00168222BC|nr:pantoate--beta-alanine ligase [Saccharopolyspora pogona]